ncbi:helix-turn-helix transcriptional regulator [Crossiella cryophila]|uniref:DNA-binding CsgD family transcriptional regulator n=1 Tax=Crossiella cryophila TaxID=43355 RepID=A0A7W7C995_9PSEU|nr:LuxR family transcriptional regulator [Crossiella cryophila]MBB4676871.1 DNA-binding CsgD family transcriptional regulator [Crossiella cryophila]
MSGRRDQQITPTADPTLRPLVGRQPLLKVLGNTLKRSTRKTFFLVELVGEPGVGKSRLVTEVANQARELGMATLAGRAAEFEQDAPFAAVVDALDDHLESQIGLLTRRLPLPEARLLSSVFPGLTIDLPQVPIPAGAGGARYRLHRAVRTLLEVLAESSGLTLLLDDVHWADEATIELLDYLVRHPPRGQVVIAVAYRPAQVSARLRTALSQVPAGQGTRVTVSPLSQKETEEFLGPGMSQAKRRRLYESSGGNPFYLEALSRAENGNGNPLAQITGDLAEDALRDVPDAVRSALQVELGQLSSKALLIAHAAAVVGDEFEPAAAAAAAELSDGEALTVLDELVGRDVVRIAPTPGRFRFRHPLVRHTAYTSASAGWRMATHGRVAAYLQKLNAPAPQLARHVVRSAGFGDVDAVGVLTQAARSVAPRAPMTASYWLTQALRLLPDIPANTGDRIQLLIELAAAQGVTSQFTEASGTALDVLERLPAQAYQQRAMVAGNIYARVTRLLGRAVEARALLQRELRAVPAEAIQHAGPLHLRLAVEAIWSAEYAESTRLLDQVPTELVPQPIAYAVAALRPMPAIAGGDGARGLALLDEADRVLVTATATDLAPWLDAFTWLCFSDLLTGRYRNALPRFERVVEIARNTGQNYILPPLLVGQAQAAAVLGDMDEAFTLTEEAIDMARVGGSQQSMAMALGSRSLLLTWSGEHTEALRVAAEATEAGGLVPEWWGLRARVAQAIAVAHSGDLDGAAADEVCDLLESVQRDQPMLLFCCEAMAHLLAGAGRWAEAAAWADRAERIADPALEINRALAGTVRAHALTGTDPAAAAELALRCAAVLEQAGLKLDAARARLRAGLAFTAAKDRVRALPELATAADAFAACRAKSLRAEALRATRRLGVRVAVPGGPKQSGPFGLSPRELEIARLVLDGHTNQQIAEKLFIGIRTVETHVSHVFTKLGVTSRASVGRVLGPALDAHDKG